MTYSEKLRGRIAKTGSRLCVGIDPRPDRIEGDLESTLNRLVDETLDYAACFKPNIAYFEALGWEGYAMLERLIAKIPDEVPVLLDAKRGDIGATQEYYAKAYFERMEVDAVTLNPFMGFDAIEPFLRYAGRAVYLLAVTSNPGSADIQSLQTTVLPGGESLPLYQRVAHMASEWNSRGNVGLVVGATQPSELKWVRERCPAMPLLIPGVGAQGGDVATAVRNGVDANGELAIINSSRAITYASRGNDFAEAARQAAIRARDRMRDAMPAKQS